jgi:hypothetical protein
MDYVPGQPLDAYMATTQPSMDETLRLFARICEAVNAAHLRGVIHRDMEPDQLPEILDSFPKRAVFDSTATWRGHPLPAPAHVRPRGERQRRCAA